MMKSLFGGVLILCLAPACSPQSAGGPSARPSAIPAPSATVTAVAGPIDKCGELVAREQDLVDDNRYCEGAACAQVANNGFLAALVCGGASVNGAAKKQFEGLDRQLEVANCYRAPMPRSCPANDGWDGKSPGKLFHVSAAKVLFFHLDEAIMTDIAITPSALETFPSVETRTVKDAKGLNRLLSILDDARPATESQRPIDARWGLVFLDASGRRLFAVYSDRFGHALAGDRQVTFQADDFLPRLRRAAASLPR